MSALEEAVNAKDESARRLEAETAANNALRQQLQQLQDEMEELRRQLEDERAKSSDDGGESRTFVDGHPYIHRRF